MDNINYPITVEKIELVQPRKTSYRKVGSWVSIRPCSEGDKTFLGVYLGDLQNSPMASYNKNSKLLTVIPFQNPAIWVPDLNRVVWGCESWWGVIEGPEDLKKITDGDIQGVWYVRALKELSETA